MDDHRRVALGDAPPQGELVELGRGACLALLSTARIGRVIYTDAAMPAALPVTYALDDEEVVFRTNRGGRLAAATRNAVVGFQVDELDWMTRTGWTVLGVGEAFEVTEPRRLAALRGMLPQLWVAGRVDHTICIPLQRLTGGRIGAEHIF